MEFITSTQIRSQFPKALAMLRLGKTIHILHRSKIVGVIQPSENEPKIMTEAKINELKKIIKEMNLPKLSIRQMEKNYRDHIMKKYGKGLS